MQIFKEALSKDDKIRVVFWIGFFMVVGLIAGFWPVISPISRFV